MHRLKSLLIAIIVVFSATAALAAGGGGQRTFGEIIDNTNTYSATVKAPNTAPTSSDNPIVVTQSPVGGNPCMNQAATLVSISGATSGTAATQIIALSAGTKIYICSMTIISGSGTAPTFSLVTGTGANCASGQAVLIAAFATATTAGTIYNFVDPVAVGPAGAALCYLDGGTTPIQNYNITYVQQ
jgi:hypothetical protein